MSSIRVETVNADIAFWQHKTNKNLTTEDVRQIKENLVGFFHCLMNGSKMQNRNIFDSANNILRQDVRAVVIGLLPHGRCEGQEYVALNPTRHDNKLGSFRINLITGQWQDFATSDKGSDIVSLYAYLLGVSQYQAAREILGNDYKNIIPFVPKAPKVNEKPISDYVGKIWRECNDTKSIVAQYFNSRCIIGVISETIKEHSSLYHKPSNSKHPAMVAAVMKQS